GGPPHPTDRARPATPIPASHTGRGWRRVVGSATTGDWPGDSRASAAWMSWGLTIAWANGGPVHQRRTWVSRARARPACSAGRARAIAAGVARWATSTPRTAQG